MRSPAPTVAWDVVSHGTEPQSEHWDGATTQTQKKQKGGDGRLTLSLWRPIAMIMRLVGTRGNRCTKESAKNLQTKRKRKVKDKLP